MYLTFYGLKEKPFNATPDPRFIYMSPAHREALAQLVYATRERKGFSVLTGRIGTGKTTGCTFDALPQQPHAPCGRRMPALLCWRKC